MEQREEILQILAGGGVGVIPTDTQYGIVASALDPDAVEHIYELRRRNPEKPFIILIADVEEVERFGVVLPDELRRILGSYWPGPVSLILRTIDDQFSYLDRDKGTLAFRVPNDEDLRQFLRDSGPLVAPSANVAGEPPATTIEEARRCFGTDADFYVDGGIRNSPPSTIIDLSGGGGPIVLRP